MTDSCDTLMNIIEKKVGLDMFWDLKKCIKCNVPFIIAVTILTVIFVFSIICSLIYFIRRYNLSYRIPTITMVPIVQQPPSQNNQESTESE